MSEAHGYNPSVGRAAELATLYLDGELTAEQDAELRSLLSNDGEARRRFVAVCMNAELVSQSLADEAAATVEPVGRIGRWRGAMAVAAAVIVVGAIAAAYLTLLRERPTEDPAVRFKPVAVLLAADDVTWDSAPSEVGESIAAGRIAISGGSLELDSTAGATVRVVGAADVDLRSADHLIVHRGRMSARIGRGAEGFTVDAPHGVSIVDLGTAFDVTVDEAGDTTLQVTEGLVELRMPDQPPTRIAAGLPLRILAGRTIERTERQDIAIANASFESPQSAPGYWRGELDGWTRIGPDENFGVNRFGAEFAEPMPDGSQLGFLNAGGIEQTLDAPLAGNVRYTLSVAVGNRPGPNSPDFTLELWAGDRRVAAAANPVVPDKGRYGRATLSFDAPPDDPALGEPLRIVLRSNGSLATHTQNIFDDVRLHAEPIVIGTPEQPLETGNIEPKGD